MINWDKHRVQLVQLGEKIIWLDNWQEYRLTKMMAQLQQELVEKEEALTKIQAVSKGNHESNPPSITTVENSTMPETTKVSSPSKNISQENIG